MDEKQFKKHLADLAHGHHHPEEHDWAEGPAQIRSKPAVEPARKKATKKRPTAARRKTRKS